MIINSKIHNWAQWAGDKNNFKFSTEPYRVRKMNNYMYWYKCMYWLSVVLNMSVATPFEGSLTTLLPGLPKIIESTNIYSS